MPHRAGVISGLGSVGGALAGLIPGVGLVWRLRHEYGGLAPSPGFASYPLHIPWADIAVVVVAAPILAMGAAALLHRFTVPTTSTISTTDTAVRHPTTPILRPAP
jgi:hypothetical protein